MVKNPPQLCTDLLSPAEFLRRYRKNVKKSALHLSFIAAMQKKETAVRQATFFQFLLALLGHRAFLSDKN